MKLVYTGPHDGVDIHLPSGLVLTVMHGADVDVPAEVGENLLAQEGNFEAVKSGGKGGSS